MSKNPVPESNAQSLAKDIASLKESGDAEFDPVRFHFIEAMASRAQANKPPVADVILGKAQQALQIYQENLASRQPVSKLKVPKAHQQLAELTALLNQSTEMSPQQGELENLLQQQERELLQEYATTNQASAPTMLELKSARQFRQTLQKIGADRRVDIAAFTSPEDSGPLNPQMLVTESLSQLRDLSPRYLSRFITYFDTLFWLEQTTGKEES